MRHVILALVLLSSTWLGCGTSKWTDTQRTATEQLLISDAMDRAVSELDLRALAGRKVYLDTNALKGATDSAYLTSTLRQHILASGCILKDKLEDADYVVEARAGSAGTDNHSLLYGVPQTSLPAMAIVPGALGPNTTIPEIPLVKKMEQRAIVKIALFAYNRTTGRPVWQSGLVIKDSKAKHLWVFGTGPFQQGEIYGETRFAGGRLKVPLVTPGDSNDDKPTLSVADEVRFVEPPEKTAKAQQAVADQKASTPPPAPPPAVQGTPSPSVVPATHAAPVGRPAGPPAASPVPQGLLPRPEVFSEPPTGAANAPMPSDRPFMPPYGFENQPTGLYPATR